MKLVLILLSLVLLDTTCGSTLKKEKDRLVPNGRNVRLEKTTMSNTKVKKKLQKKEKKSTSKCKDDDTFLYKNDEGKDCAWLDQKKKRKKNEICKEANVLKACPKTCGACETTCPLKMFSSEFDQSCNKDGLTCNYNYIYTGCTWNSLQCTSQQFYECDQSEWVRASNEVASCENLPKDLPLYEECEPCPEVKPADKCQSKRPDNDSKCTQVGLKCKYGFRLTCNLKELQCEPTEWYTCTEGNVWRVMMVDIEINC